ncbi:AraC family transcriptional regulator [Galbibacter sp. BG1]|uniref:helix-turn-helix domain-containing protein n=1 Tax=Galbibacter sp. BG1 TaxID=1170699 RepID=UPI0015BF42B1|nr:helix-turn-helix domain-containing protein [Galbibacter sp. BG1]QLE02190.1 AraC family transcriptional regulator [Galbibacter sp. BG1]
MAVFIFIWGFLQSFIVGLIIPIVKSARNNYMLSAIFIMTAFNVLLQYLLRFENLRIDYPHFLITPDIFDLFLPPLVLLYIKVMMGQDISTNKYRYFIVPLVWSAVLVCFVSFSSDISHKSYLGSTFHKTSLSVIFLWKLFIVYKGYQLLKFSDLSLKQKQEELLLWPRVLVIFLGILTFIAFTYLCYFMLITPNFEEKNVVRETVRNMVQMNYVLFTCSIIFLTIFFSLKYPRILSGLPVIKSIEKSDFPEGEAYVKELEKLIYEKKIHLDTELNEKKLADAMGIHSYILSKLLNEYLGKSFSEYINEKRIEESKKLLSKETNKKLTNFAIAVDSGFRSESVFYINFKKITGYTPTQYKKQVMGKKSAS